MSAKSESEAPNRGFQFKPVLDFWYGELSDSDRWSKGKLLDPVITERFGAVHKAAAELWQWRESPEGRLAEIIVLDQFSRHIFRNTPAALASDPVACSFICRSCTANLRKFTKRPANFAKAGDTLKYEAMHLKIIKRFGRYPHRNEILSRISSAEEIEFLKTPGSSFP